ncbi:MAG: hypothetical protein WCF77_01345 [Minisyncoccia bacterium]|jgi:hypothetical protein
MKHISAILVFTLAVMLQIWFAPAGMRGDFVLAALIIFALLFDLWELAAFVLLAVFLLNPSPLFNFGILVFALIPFAVYFLRRRFSWDPWIGGAFGIVCGVLLLSVAIAPAAAFHVLGHLLLDVLACVLFGELILCGMEA